MNNKLRRQFERFCYRNRSKGIPNLMLYLCLGSGIVTFAGLLNGGGAVYDLLCFDKSAILNGQIWRLVSWVFTDFLGGNLLLSLLFLYFFYRFGSAVEHSIGTFKFNLFYLSGIILMDLFAMIACPTEVVNIAGAMIAPESFTAFYGRMSYFLHLSMVLAFATMYPDAHFLIMYVIPVKAWIIALVDLIMIAVSVFNLCYPILFFPHCLFPLIGLFNYFLFFGPDMGNLLPLSWRVKLRRKHTNKPIMRSDRPKTIPFPQAENTNSGTAKPKAPYTHRCTICGRTDTEFPDLEFRYCSRCQGYHCYCEDHISNHSHIE